MRIKSIDLKRIKEKEFWCTIMTEIKRTLRCAGCGYEANFYLSSDMNLNELLVYGKCPRCGNSLQVNFNIVGAEAKPPEATSSESSSVNFENTIFDAPTEISESENIEEIIDSR